MLRNKKQILNDYINECKGKYDYHYVVGSYGMSYNMGLDYFSIYHIVEDDREIKGYYIEEAFFQGRHEYFELFGKNFLENTENTQMKKIRHYFKEYMY